jgi:hypothetical protein
VTAIIVGTVVLAAINFAYKATGPVVLADREPTPTVTELITALSPALLAGLVTVELLGPRWQHTDETAVPGLVAAAVAHRLHAPELACVAIAVLVTAGLRWTPG